MSASACSQKRPEAGLRLGALLVSLLLIAGCVTKRGVDLPDISEWDMRTSVLGQLDEFEFSGRIGVTTGDDGFNGRLRWYQDEEAFRATVGGPLGIGTVRIEGDGPNVELTDNDGETTRLVDVETDLYYRYGWTIPVESLRFWALGIPDPRAPATTEFGEEGELVSLEQRGWLVTIGRYREAGGGQQMPSRLTATNESTKVRLVIDRWIFREQISP